MVEIRILLPFFVIWQEEHEGAEVYPHDVPQGGLRGEDLDEWIAYQLAVHPKMTTDEFASLVKRHFSNYLEMARRPQYPQRLQPLLQLYGESSSIHQKAEKGGIVTAISHIMELFSINICLIRKFIYIFLNKYAVIPK